jgi:DNA-binding NtrC family response regulator
MTDTKPTVLIIEHQRIITDKLIELLEKEGFNCEHVESDTSLSRVVTPDHPYPDVILFAGSMRRLDGETKGPNSAEARFIAALPDNAYKKAIVLGDPMNLGYAVNKVAYAIPKDPFNPDVFVSMVKEVASRR